MTLKFWNVLVFALNNIFVSVLTIKISTLNYNFLSPFCFMNICLVLILVSKIINYDFWIIVIRSTIHIILLLYTKGGSVFTVPSTVPHSDFPVFPSVFAGLCTVTHSAKQCNYFFALMVLPCRSLFGQWTVEIVPQIPFAFALLSSAALPPICLFIFSFHFLFLVASLSLLFCSSAAHLYLY